MKITKLHRIILCIMLLIFLLIGYSALAAGEAPPRSLVSTAGGQVSAGGLRLHSALGQPASGIINDPSPGSEMRLCSGFICGLPTERRVFLPAILK